REDETPPHDPLLLEIEKRFMRPRRDNDRALPASDALTVLRSTGQRNEAEAIAVEIAKLIAADVPADQIAIAVEAPAQNGRVIRDTLERFRIPVTLEAETRVGATVTGRSLLHLLAAAGPADSATDLLAFLRSPLGPDRELTDLLEREMRINGIDSASAATGLLTDVLEGEAPAFWPELTAALASREPVHEIIAAGARSLSLAILAGDDGAVPSAATVIETQAGSAIARASQEVGEFRGSGDGMADIVAALDSDAVKVWAVPANGTVRIASPYSLRAKRVEYLFCASLQESGLSDTDRAGPFLSVKDRSALLMSEHRDPEVQQRYLFYSSITVPTRRLWLSCRTSDETGKAEHPSPLIGAVEELFGKGENEIPLVKTGGRSGSEIIFQPADAPSVDELARSLAGSSKAGDRAGDLAGAGDNRLPLTDAGDIEEQLAESLLARLEAATDVEQRTRRLGSLTLDPIVSALGEAAVFGATEIEAYAGCPYRWFIERQLNPQPFEPDPDYLTMGTLLHESLEDLYRAHLGEIPRPGTLDTWLQEVPIVVADHARSRRIGLGSDSVSHAALRNRATQLISAHLRRESAWLDPRHLPGELEAKIGTRDSEIPALDMGDWSLKGKIDRVDFSPATSTSVPREAVVVDYKSGNLDKASQGKARKERKFQVQLYLHAVRRIWGATPVAGVYVPLRTGQNPSRGAYAAEVHEEMQDRGVSKSDKLEDLDGFIREGLEMATEAVTALMTGILEHDPSTCPDHFDHPAVPDRPPAEEEAAGAGAR
ncbi:MAG: PD-(D/E)XK nuclease family protein, partial [Actinomycetota bacterium]|nr:PD-(D/E)XK nuclease family protein [Actinomycetota bacterium]